MAVLNTTSATERMPRPVAPKPWPRKIEPSARASLAAGMVVEGVLSGTRDSVRSSDGKSLRTGRAGDRGRAVCPRGGGARIRQAGRDGTRWGFADVSRGTGGAGGAAGGGAAGAGKQGRGGDCGGGRRGGSAGRDPAVEGQEHPEGAVGATAGEAGGARAVDGRVLRVSAGDGAVFHDARG